MLRFKRPLRLQKSPLFVPQPTTCLCQHAVSRTDYLLSATERRFGPFDVVAKKVKILDLTFYIKFRWLRYILLSEGCNYDFLS